jgi:hypothetical protein
MLRKEHKLQVFGNKMLRKWCGLKGDEISGKFMMLHSKECHLLLLVQSNQGYYDGMSMWLDGETSLEVTTWKTKKMI